MLSMNFDKLILIIWEKFNSLTPGPMSYSSFFFSSLRKLKTPSKPRHCIRGVPRKTTTWPLTPVMSSLYMSSRTSGGLERLMARWGWVLRIRALFYYCDMTPSQEFKPMWAQLPLKAVLPLAEGIATALDRCGKTGPRAVVEISLEKLSAQAIFY